MTAWSNDQSEMLIRVLRHQADALERLAEAVIQLLPSAVTPHYHYPLEQFASFDWPSIGALVEQIDQHGPAVVLWNGRRFTRRWPQDKFGKAIWFSRCIGMGEDSKLRYESLITFRSLAAPSPSLEKVQQLLTR